MIKNYEEANQTTADFEMFLHIPQPRKEYTNFK